MYFRHISALFLVAIFTSSAAASSNVEFEESGLAFLPYTEDGLTFTQLVDENDGLVFGGLLVLAGEVFPSRVRANGSERFDLLSIEIDNFARSWRIESSKGDVVQVTTTGIMSFENMAGWQNIDYFDFVHSPTEPLSLLQIENVVVGFGLAGDYNESGTVDAADYTVWRDNLGNGEQLPNDDSVGVGDDDYDRWKSRFGQAFGFSAAHAIPEPSTLSLFAIGCAAIGCRRRQHSQLREKRVENGSERFL